MTKSSCMQPKIQQCTSSGQYKTNLARKHIKNMINMIINHLLRVQSIISMC